MVPPGTTSISTRLGPAITPEQAYAWQQFVDSHLEATNFHRWGWKQVIENAFGWPTWYLMAEEAGVVRGILPLVWQKSRLFGSFVTSMPFLNAGGLVTENPHVERLLLDEAIAITRRLRADHLELRHRSNHHLDLPTKTSKLVVVKAVRADPEKMFQELDKKVRADVRKSQRSGFTADFGGEEFLEDFYRVFAVNMRDLGTPVYALRFFREIFHAFPAGTWICRVRLGERTVAASFLTGYRDSIEVAWSSSLREYLPLKPNMFLYWNLLCFAASQGYKIFDFGRSTRDSGTHNFKTQWGTEEFSLYWSYWLRRRAELPQVNPENPKYRMFIRGWQKLPVFLTRWIGPRIVRCLP
jgi:FemAB-related protein (PEP-CTERM system-associated)